MAAVSAGEPSACIAAAWSWSASTLPGSAADAVPASVACIATAWAWSMAWAWLGVMVAASAACMAMACPAAMVPERDICLVAGACSGDAMPARAWACSSALLPAAALPWSGAMPLRVPLIAKSRSRLTTGPVTALAALPRRLSTAGPPMLPPRAPASSSSSLSSGLGASSPRPPGA